MSNADTELAIKEDLESDNSNKEGDATVTEQALGFLDMLSDELKARATEMVKEFKDRQKELGKGKPVDEWTKLGLRIRTPGGSVYIEWAQAYWGKQNKRGGNIISKYLKRDRRSFSYNLNNLRKYAADWEHEMVEEYEKAFTQLRKYNHHLAHARIQLREAIKAEKALEAMNEERITDDTDE